MGWDMTVYGQDGDGWEATVFETPAITGGRHGQRRITDKDWYGLDVIVYDNTEDGMSEDEFVEVARKAWECPIFWSDDRLCHWLWDRDVTGEGRRFEGLFHGNGLPDGLNEFKPLHVNVFR